MAQLLGIKNRIKSVASTLKITNAMKMIATAKLSKARDRLNKVKPVYERIENVTHRFIKFRDSKEIRRLCKKGECSKVLFVVLSTNRGFCGGFNLKLFNHVEEEIEKKFNSEDLYILPIGQKAIEYYEKYPNLEKLKANINIHWERDLFDQSRNIVYELRDLFLEDKYSEIYIVYNRFKSILLQNPTIKPLFPIDIKDNPNVTDSDEAEYLFEPSEEVVEERLLDSYIIMTVNFALIEQETGEYGARMTAMDGANRNGEELNKKLKIQYQRARQEDITKEITEIIGGAETLRRNKDE